MFGSDRSSTPFLLFLIITVLVLVGVPGRHASAATGPALSINAGADQHTISPLIYGMNFADAGLAQDVRLPVDRWGGNSTTRYNWKLDVHNTGSDYYFENIPDGDSTTLPNDSAADRFIEQDRGTSTQTLLTVPLIGWTPSARKEQHPYDCGFPKTLFPSQLSFDQYDLNCGNGLNPSGTPVTSSSTAANTSVAIDPVFVKDWMRHLIGRYGTAAQGGVKLYNLDNEPGLWDSTHRDVHPTRPTYDELIDRGKQYAAAIKAVDPGALTLGPVQDGWTRYFYSSYGDYPDVAAQLDREEHQGKPFVVSYLQQMAAYETANHTRLLDYFDLHYYPATTGVTLSPAGDAATQTKRLASTRSLWDPTWVDEDSWIPETDEATAVNGVGVDGAIQLIPRMRDWIAKNYPGTKLAITEYNWGALDHINGALAQADVLGIFGREGLDLATLWEAPNPLDPMHPEIRQPGEFAFRMYRNYDGQGAGFGDTSVRASSADQGQLAIYAARRNGDGALTIMIINKSAASLTSQISLAEFRSSGTAQVYRYSAANAQQIVKQADQSVGSSFSATFPPNSITLMVLPKLSVPLTPRVDLPLVRR
ncbi:MAG: glycoside hydrolase family 44 protein [Roseiflexaceae bacterium]